MSLRDMDGALESHIKLQVFCMIHAGCRGIGTDLRQPPRLQALQDGSLQRFMLSDQAHNRDHHVQGNGMTINTPHCMREPWLLSTCFYFLCRALA